MFRRSTTRWPARSGGTASPARRPPSPKVTARLLLTGGAAANRAGPSGLELVACQDAGVTQQPHDLVIRNGTIVTPGHREQADVGLTGGRIAQLGGAMTGAGEIDAGGLLVIPGGIDAHVHLVSARLAARMAVAEPGEPVWADDFWTGSLAAIAGGITTIGNMTFALAGESMTQAV